MSVQMYAAAWPTEETLAELRVEPAFAEAFNSIEGLVMKLRALLEPYEENPDTWPDPAPTLETVGRLWSCLDGLHSDLENIGTEVLELEQLIRSIDHMRLDCESTQGREMSS